MVGAKTHPGLKLVLTLVLALFPLVVYMGYQHWGLSKLIWVLIAILIVRLLLTANSKPWVNYGLIVVLLLVGGWLMMTDNADLLFYYPVLMNWTMALLFLASLFREKTLVETMAAMVVKKIPAYAANYMRQLTKLWGLVLIINGGVAAYTACCLSVTTWAFYNGFLSYVLMLLLMVAEMIFRRFYRRRYAMSVNHHE